MKPSYVLPGISTNQVKLGRLVTNVWTPHNSFHDPPTISDTDISSQLEIHKVIRHSSEFYNHTHNKCATFLKLSKFFGINLDSSSNVIFKVKARSTTTEALSNYSDLFRSIWRGGGVSTTSNPGAHMDATREWVQNRIEDGEDVYMVVGITTATDATVVVDVRSATITGPQVGVPTSDMALPGISSLANASALDVILAMAVGQCGTGIETHEMNGTHVIAVQYCKVKVGKWWKKKSEEPRLASGHVVWKWFVGPNRSMNPPPVTDEEMMMDASLGEPVTMDVLGPNEEDAEEDQRIENVLLGDGELLF